MANIAFTITIDDAEVLVAQGQLATRLAHMTPVIEDIGRALGNLIEDAFQAEPGSPVGWGEERTPTAPAANRWGSFVTPTYGTLCAVGPHCLILCVAQA
jgi:hypothetical protein